MRVGLTDLTRAQLGPTRLALWHALDGAPAPGTLELDFAGVRALDSAGAALLARLLAEARARRCTVSAVNVHPAVARSLGLFPAELPVVRHAPRAADDAGVLERTGAWAAAGLEVLLEAASLVRALGRAAVTSVRGPRRGGLQATLREMDAVGVQAAGVVGAIAFLVGVTVALQSAAQLRQFGANVFVVDLVAVAITRELGPLMAAIVVAGRSGAAAAAEVSTMVITEEIDALRTMGVDPVRFVVWPKLVAIVAMQPLLAVWANAVAIAGAFVVAVGTLELSPATFASRLQQAMELRDVVLGLVKSCCFGALIMGIAAVVGLRTNGGAEAVGRSTTRSVVAAIFAIIVADAAFSLLFNLGH